ncbi:MAG: endonuclease III [Spirochaetaceae bacterium]|jgi:endonuclease-3|nr:endonuclease III [Spirochaetaceae bacterium]
MTSLSSAAIDQIFRRFQAANPHPESELKAPNPFTFLVAVVLSAQATDVGVNKAAPALFAVADTPEKMLALGEDQLIPYIKTIGLYRSKARHIMGLSAALVERFGGHLPRTREELESLPGVGPKSANVVLNVVFGEPAMPVDTHLLRVSPRIGLSDGTTPQVVERDLVAQIPAPYLHHAHHWLLLHGRYVCTARKPHCTQCLIADLCAHKSALP